MRVESPREEIKNCRTKGQALVPMKQMLKRI